MSKTLSPCPFCGAEGYATYKTNDHGDKDHHVFCQAECGGWVRNQVSEKKAISAWNRRAAKTDCTVSACAVPVSDKSVCGAQNAKCDPQQAAPPCEQKGDLVGWLRRRSTPMGCIITGKLAGEIADRIDTLQTQQAGNKIDAERYRWLRDNNGVDNDREVEIIIGGESRMPGHLCEQIDKAMQQGGQP